MTNFPTSPAEGETFTSDDGVQYQYESAGPRWKIKAAATVSHTALGDIGTLTHPQIDLATAVISPITIAGGGGFVLDYGSYYGAAWGVDFSDTDAGVSASFHVTKGGTFKGVVTLQSIDNNNGKTVGGGLYVDSIPNNTAAGAYILSGVVANIGTFGNGVYWVLQYTHATTFTVADGDLVTAYWYKTDNAGGATGNLGCNGIALVRQ